MRGNLVTVTIYCQKSFPEPSTCRGNLSKKKEGEGIIIPRNKN